MIDLTAALAASLTAALAAPLGENPMRHVNTTENPTINLTPAHLVNKKKFLFKQEGNVAKRVSSSQRHIDSSYRVYIEGVRHSIAGATGTDLKRGGILVPSRMPEQAIDDTVSLWNAFGELVNNVTGQYEEFNAEDCLVALFEADRLLKSINDNHGYDKWESSTSVDTELGKATIDTYPSAIVKNIHLAVRGIGWTILNHVVGNVATLLDSAKNSPENFGLTTTGRSTTLEGIGYVDEVSYHLPYFKAADELTMESEHYDTLLAQAKQYITDWNDSKAKGDNKGGDVMGRFKATAEASLDVFMYHGAERHDERNAQRAEYSKAFRSKKSVNFAARTMKKIIAGVEAEISNSNEGLRLGYVDNEATRHVVSAVRENIHDDHLDDFEEALATIRSFITGADHGSDAKKTAMKQVKRIIRIRADERDIADATFQPLYWLAISLVHRIIEVAD